MNQDIERLKDLRDQLKDMEHGTGKNWLRPDYCKQMGEVLDRSIDRLEETAEFCDYVLIEPNTVDIPERPVSAQATRWASEYPWTIIEVVAGREYRIRPYRDRQDDYF